MNCDSLRVKLSSLFETLARPAPSAAVVGAAIMMLLGMSVLQSWVETAADPPASSLSEIKTSRARLSEAVGEYRSLTELRSHDIAQMQADLSTLTRSRRVIFESTVGLQEEQRLLSKQWEIMSTYLLLDEQAKKIHLMREEQALESYPATDAPPLAFGEEAERLPGIVRVVSKERFASPERGSYNEINGQLVWNPPQVGTSIRSNALGEFVTFTNGPLILHGPPKKTQEHEAYSHYCLELSLATAQKLFKNTFIGTKVVLKGSPEQKEAAQKIPAPATKSAPPKKSYRGGGPDPSPL